MNRLAGIIVAVIGLIICVLSIVRVLPGLVSTGVSLMLLGALLFGLSFIRRPETEGVEKMSTPATLGGVYFSPGETFKNLRYHPRWLAALLVVSAFAALYSNAFMSRLGPDRVANYAIDKTLEMSILNDDARKQIEAGRAAAIAENKDPIKRAGQAVNSFVGSVFWAAFIAAVFMLFALAMGGTMNFWQAFSVAAYVSFAIGTVRYLLSLIFLYLKDPAEIHPILGQGSLVQDNPNFLVSPAENPVFYVLLSSISILGLYWIILTVIGLKNAGDRVSSSTAWTATMTLWLVGVVLGVLMAMLFPSFMS
jgi:Yip1 domain